LAENASIAAVNPLKLRCDGCPGRLRGICEPLDDGRLAELLAHGTTRRWARGSTMFIAGEPLKMFYKVTSGIAALLHSLPDGRRHIVELNSIGDLCGYLARNGTYLYSGEAITDVEACAFDRSHFDAFVPRHPDLAQALMEAIAAKLMRAQANMVALGQLKSTEKVANLLCQFDDLYSNRLNVADRTLVLHLTRAQIGDYLGLTLESVSRAFSTLKDKQLIAPMGRADVAILDKQRLKQFARLPVV
jgi:CRP/FNR family transcriptional regulator, anaerobic regulatory protein